MIVSRCCKEIVHVACSHEGLSFYVCNSCSLPCDTIFSMEMEKDKGHDTRSKNALKEFAYLT